MGTHLRSAVAPLLLTLGLAGVLAASVHDLERHKNATCAGSPLARSLLIPRPERAVGNSGAIHLSRFDRAEIWGCGGPDTARHSGILP